MDMTNDTSSLPCTVVNYCQAKVLTPDKVQSYGITDSTYRGESALRIPYFDAHGKEVCVRYRTALSGGDKFKWEKGSAPTLYGLWKINEAVAKKYVLLVEGESDCHTAWEYGEPALGIPGASNWKQDWDQCFVGISRIIVFIEADKGGSQVLDNLAESSIKDRVSLAFLKQTL